MLNKVCLMGRLTRAPELKTTQSGTAVVGFTLAVDRDYVKKGEDRKADFISCVAWRGTAEFIARYFGKGDMLALDGRIETRTWEDKDGNKRTAVEVIADSVYFCGGKKSAEAEPEYKNEAAEFEGNSAEDNDDLPF